MQLSRFLFLVASALLPVCLLSTTWLYLYPLFHGCGFPTPEASAADSTPPAALPARAPFRLLALGDPQLEGDSSLPDPRAPAFPALRYVSLDLAHAKTWRRKRNILTTALTKVVTRDLPRWLEGQRKRLDLWGNDLYLAHIVRQLRWWTRPSHVAVLGDLLGSQWISDAEFSRRSERYWRTVLAGMERVPDHVMGDAEEEAGYQGGTIEMLGEDESWENRVINVAGNHDIGYAGDLDERRMQRFEKAFGKANWDIVFKLTPPRPGSDDGHGIEPPALRLVILNSMNIDTPALSEALQHDTYSFINHVITTSRPVTDKTHATVLLTHIPLHKKSGVCVDEPFFDFFDTGAGVKEQNMLSDYASAMLLQGIFGLSGNPSAEGQGFGRRGIIINGHDHAGCDVVHYVAKTEFSCPPAYTSDALHETDASYTGEANATETPEWHVLRVPASDPFPLHPSARTQLGECLPFKETPHLREVTLRSMMGDYSGYAGFLSAWFDESIGERGEWRLEFATCGVGVQHWWWAVHAVDFTALLALVAGLLAMVVEKVASKKKEDGPREEAANKKGVDKKDLGKKKTLANGVAEGKRVDG